MNDNKGVFGSVADKRLPLQFELYGLKDIKGNAFLPPMMFRNRAEAIRNIGYLVKNDQAGDVSKFPGDFQLWQLGMMELDTGHLIDSLEFVIDVSAIIG